jgi:hypothetical protein
MYDLLSKDLASLSSIFYHNFESWTETAYDFRSICTRLQFVIVWVIQIDL